MTTILTSTFIFALMCLFVAFTSKKGSTIEKAYLYAKITGFVFLAELIAVIIYERS